MSQTRRTSHDCKMFIINPNIVRALRIMLPAAVVLAMVWPASAASISWTSVANGQWSNSANWTPAGPPISSSDVLFTNLTGNPALYNEVSYSTSINSIQYSQDSAVYTTNIAPSILMRILGSSAAPAGSNGNVSLWAGAIAPGNNSVSQTLFTGGGQMDISSPTGGNTQGDIVVRESQATAGNHIALLDLSGLSSLNANIDQILVGFSTASSGGGDRPNGSLYLAQNNTITMNDTAYSTAGTGIRDAGLIIGYTGHATSGDLIHPTEILYLGQTNVLNLASATIAGARATAAMTFNPVFLGGATKPTVTMRGIGGGDTRVGTIVIGDNWNDAAGKTNTAAGTLDLTGGVADIKADTIILGRTTQNGGSNASATVARGTLTFDAGTIDVNTLMLGYQSSALTAATTGAYGRVNVNGTANLVVNTSMELGHVAVTGSLTPIEGTLNIRNSATVTMGGDIIDGGVSTTGANTTISMSGGTLNMQGHNIGNTSVPLDTFTAGGGSVTNLGILTVSTFKVNTNYSLSSGTLSIANSGLLDMRNTAANTLSVGTLALPSGTSTMYFEVSGTAGSGNDQISVTTLNLNSGTTSIKVSPLGSTFDSAPYHLIHYTSETGTGGTFTVSNTTRNAMSVSDNTTTKNVDLTITPHAPLTLIWSGAVGTSSAPTTWDWATTQNWNNNVDKYYDLDTVTFQTNAGGASFVKLQNTYPGATTAGVGFYPGSVAVSSDSDYTFTANTANVDRISGTTGLTKSGTGTLTISLSNDYTGATNLNAGKIMLGNNAALGSASAALNIANNATLDLNTYQLFAKPITVQGAGADGVSGAIINSNTSTAPAATQYDASNITLSGDTTIGGTSTIVTNSSGLNTGLPGNQYMGRWSVRANSGTATINTTATAGNHYTLTKVGNNQIMLVNVAVATSVGDVNVNMGVLGLEGTSNLGDPANYVTVDGTHLSQPRGGSILQMNNLSVALDKKVVLKNNGQLYALQNSADTSTTNTVSGSVAIDDTGGILNAGGVRADYAANSNARMTISGVLSGSSAAVLAKNGPGTVTLSGANTFSGTTNLNDGTLIVNSTLPGLGITMATGTVTTTLAGIGTVGGTVTDASGAVISPGSTSAAGSVGTLTLGGLALTGGGQINLDMSTDPLACDLININGNLSIAGTTQINIPNISTLASNTYLLMKYTGTLTKTGTIGLLNIPQNTRRHFDITYVTNTNPTPSQVNFSLSGSAASLVWTGNGDSTSWDVVTTQNWLNSSTPDIFYNLDNVTFNDSSANQTVTLYNNVAPGSITVDTARTYTITGQNKITGTTGLTKSGSGTLILANGSGSAPNDFSGPIQINLGTLQVGDGSTGNVVIGTGAITNNGQLVFNQTESHTVANVISGTGSVEQKGAGTLTLSGSNTYDGITTITSGTLQAGNSTALGSTVGGTTIKDGATLDVNNMNLGDEIVTVQGKGIGSNGAIVNSNTTTSTTAQNALRFVVLTGDTWLGGQAATDTSGLGPIANSGRWEIRGVPTELATINTNGQPYNITKVGNNQVSFVRLTADTALANINIGATVDGNYVPGGVLDLIANTAVGDPTKTINVLGYGSILQLEGLTTPLAKNIQLDGGTLYALSNSSATDNTVLGTVTITDNGGTINTGGIRASDVTSANAGASITMNGALSGSSAAILTKKGPGTLTLTNANNTFSGTLNHTDGTLIVNGSLAGNIAMTASSTVTTTLAGNGTISGAVSDYYSTNIAPGATAAAGSIGTLNFGSLTLGANGSGKITMDLSNDPGNGKNDLINVSGPLDVSGGSTNVSFNVISGYLLGSVGGTKYPLIHYASLTGGAANFALPTIDSRQTYSIVNDASAKNIDLLVTGAVANLTWHGDGSANAWDVKTTLNWTGADSKFWTGDQVLFDDSSANLTVNIAPTTVMPGTVTVSSGHNYIFAGTGNISGGTSLTKSGTGSLTINTSNDYSGPTTINQGTIVLGTANALGNATGTITINGTTGGTLDLNIQQLYAKPIIVQGVGVGGHGAIVNNNTTLVPAGTQYDVSNVTLSGNTTIGGTSTLGVTNSGLPGNQYVGRWSLRAQSGVTAVLSTNGNAYTLTKVGNNQIMLVDVTADTALGNVFVNEGVLSLQGTTALGTLSAITVNGTALGQPAGGSILQLRTLTVPVSQNISLQNNGQIYALLNNATTDNVVTGTVTIASTGGQFNAGGVRDDYSANPNATMTISGNILGTGSLSCPGPGTVIITSPTVSFSGNTTVNSGTLQINSPVGASVALHAVSGGGKLGIGDGTVATSVTADSVSMNTLTIGAGATLTIAAIPGGPLAGAGSISPVPEPATWAMLMLAAMGLGIYWRRR